MVRLLALLLLCALPAEAGPLAWMKRHPLATEIIGGVISAGVSARGLQVCRQQNVENCTAHYGGAWASYGAAEALHFTAIGIGHKIGSKTGAVIAHGSNALDLGYGAWEWHGGLNKPKGDSDETHHPDLRSVVIIRR